MTRIKLRLTGKQHRALHQHLFPSDALEAVAFALCGRRRGERVHLLTAQKLVLVPYAHCRRAADRVTWSTETLVPLLAEASGRDLGIVKFHSHPSGIRQFSELDDRSDAEIFGSVFSWIETGAPHATAVMLPTGELRGRAVLPSLRFEPLASISVAGDDLRFWYPDPLEEEGPEFAIRQQQLFGLGTVARLRRLVIAVVGCSGIGGIVVELLGRLGVGCLVLVDPDRVEVKNLNRILNATREDAILSRLKVEVAGRAVARMGLGTEVTLIPENIITPKAMKAVAECDVVFGCMDGAEGRHALNRLATFYLVPYLDLGVRLDADGEGGIEQVCGAVRALQPDGSSLLSRGVYTMERVKAEGLRRIDPVMYAEHVRAGYLRGIDEDRPAVASVNMQVASMAVNEFIARLHPYRDEANEQFATVTANLVQGTTYNEAEGLACPVLSRHVGRGDVVPLLDRPDLSE